jgi:hypothetical protein
MTDDPAVPVVCPECETETRVPVSEVADRLASHNDSLHDGRDVARVDPDVADRVADMAAEDLGLL